MDRLAAMRLFVAVTDAGSFSEAARAMDASPAQVSKRVAQLEEHLGARLLERTTRSVSLTPAGAAYVDRARALLAELDALEDGVRADHAAPAGELRVTAPEVFGARCLTGPLLAFLDRYPLVSARVNLTDRMVDLVDEGVDVAVRIGRLPDSNLIAKRLAPAALALVARPDDEAVHAARPDDLIPERLIIDVNFPTPRRWTFTDGEEIVEVKPAGRLTVDSAEAARAAVLAGAGVALSPRFVVAQDVEEGRLTVVAPRWSAPERDVYAVFPQNKYMAQRVRLFVDHLAGEFGAEPWWDGPFR